MAINGEIRQLYADREKTKPIYPRVSSNAVFLGNGNSLEALEASVENHSSNIQSAQSDIDKLKFVIIKLEADGWSGSAPYTQTVSIPGMTADWIPGVPSFIPYFNSDGSVHVTNTVIGMEYAAYIKILVSGNGTLTAICPEDKPPWGFWLRVPGMVERS